MNRGQQLEAVNPLRGRWRIVFRSNSDEFLNKQVEASIVLNDRGRGKSQFGKIQGQLALPLSTRNGKPAVERSKDGNAELKVAQGRG